MDGWLLRVFVMGKSKEKPPKNPACRVGREGCPAA
jgi:hypothetical protein